MKTSALLLLLVPGCIHADHDQERLQQRAPADLVPVAFDFSWVPQRDFGNGASGAFGVPVWTQWFKQNPSASAAPAIITQCSNMAVWGTSFDDGPSEFTPTLLDWFSKTQHKTTFFVIGSNAISYPDALYRAFQAGHQLASHTWSHPDLKSLSDDDVVAELVYGIMAIRTITGKTPKYYRPPMGNVDDRVQALAGMMGLTTVVWSHDSEDWTFAGKPEMRNVLTAFQQWMDQGVQGAISLEHDLWRFYYLSDFVGEPGNLASASNRHVYVSFLAPASDSVEVGIQAMELLVNNNRTIVPVSDCLQDPTPYNNAILEGFFQSGQFAERQQVLPFRLGTLSPQATTQAPTKATTQATLAASTAIQTMKVPPVVPSATFASVEPVTAGSSFVESTGRSAGLSAGAISGIAIGAAAAGFLLVAGAVMAVRWDHEKRASRQKPTGTAAASESQTFLTV
ncbi:chitin deacetylase [Chytriomyces hyalinus]|nr:chitin deacetylase [Chytriomyces hyalinus]